MHSGSMVGCPSSFCIDIGRGLCSRATASVPSSSPGCGSPTMDERATDAQYSRGNGLSLPCSGCYLFLQTIPHSLLVKGVTPLLTVYAHLSEKSWHLSRIARWIVRSCTLQLW